MKVTEDKQQLVVVDFDWWWAAGAAVSFLFLIWHLLWHPTGFIFSVMALVVWGGFCGAFVWLGTRSSFVFDKVEQVVRWSRLGLMGRRGGEVPFSEIRDVVLRQEWPDLDLPTERICLRTCEDDIPIQAGFMLDEDREFYVAFAKVRKTIRDSTPVQAS